MMSLLRLGATAMTGWLFYVAVMSYECAAVAVARSPGLACLPPGEGLTTGLIASVTAASTGVALLFLAWAPPIVRRRRERAKLEASLLQNLDRISTEEEVRANGEPDRERMLAVAGVASSTSAEIVAEGAGIEAPAATGAAEQPDLYARRVSEMREELASGSESPRSTFARWLRLLKELDREHTRGGVPTEDFCRLNSELLEMMPTP